MSKKEGYLSVQDFREYVQGVTAFQKEMTAAIRQLRAGGTLQTTALEQISKVETAMQGQSDTLRSLQDAIVKVQVMADNAELSNKMQVVSGRLESNQAELDTYKTENNVRVNRLEAALLKLIKEKRATTTELRAKDVPTGSGEASTHTPHGRNGAHDDIGRPFDNVNPPYGTSADGSLDNSARSSLERQQGDTGRSTPSNLSATVSGDSIKARRYAANTMSPATSSPNIDGSETSEATQNNGESGKDRGAFYAAWERKLLALQAALEGRANDLENAEAKRIHGTKGNQNIETVTQEGLAGRAQILQKETLRVREIEKSLQKEREEIELEKTLLKDHALELEQRLAEIQKREAIIAQDEWIVAAKKDKRGPYEQQALEYRRQQDIKALKKECQDKLERLNRAEDILCRKHKLECIEDAFVGHM